MTIDDIKQVASLAERFHTESIYKDLDFDLCKFSAVLKQIVEMDKQIAIVYIVNNVIVGAMAGYVSEYFFGKDKIAGEYGVFIDKNHRGGYGVIKIIKYFENWAIGQGAKIIQLGVSANINADKVGRLYQKLGYNDTFQVYRKGLNKCV